MLFPGTQPELAQSGLLEVDRQTELGSRLERHEALAASVGGGV